MSQDLSYAGLASFIADSPQEFALFENPDGSIELLLGPFTEHDKQHRGLDCFYFNDFFLGSEKPYFGFSERYRISKADRKSLAKARLASPAPVLWEDFSSNAFSQSYVFCKKLIDRAQISKAVPVCFHTGKFEQSIFNSNNLSALLSPVIAGRPGLYSYAVRRGRFLVLGATPEILFSIDSKEKLLKTEAVAGSILAPDSPLKQITEKLIEEHELVVKDLVDQFSAYGKPLVGEVTLKNLSALCHLRTPIELKYDHAPSADLLIKTLHPTGALGLLPRFELNHPYLKALDQSNQRGCFGAPLGLLNADGSAHILVAIRNLMIDGDCVKLGTGAGITARSEEAAEIDEIIAKQNLVKSFFNLL